jgi:hypothetical protein
MTQANLETVFDHLNARRRRDVDSIAAQLDPDIVHQGVEADLVCTGRDQVLDNVRRGMAGEDFGIDHIEMLGCGDRVVVGLGGPRFEDVPWLQGQLFIVYTLRDGRIVRMDDYRTRPEALAAAGSTAPDWR